MASANANTRSLAASARGRARADARRSAASRTRFAHRVRASAEPATELVPLEERLAIALKEDTSLPPPEPAPAAPLPDLTELAEMAFLEVSDEELRERTPAAHGVLLGWALLNEVDLAAAERSEELYCGDAWRMPLRPDDVADSRARRHVRRVQNLGEALRQGAEGGQEGSGGGGGWRRRRRRRRRRAPPPTTDRRRRRRTSGADGGRSGHEPGGRPSSERLEAPRRGEAVHRGGGLRGSGGRGRSAPGLVPTSRRATSRARTWSS